MAALMQSCLRFRPLNVLYAVVNLYSVYPINKILNEMPFKEPAKVQGWVGSVRKMKEIVFVDINDGSCCNKLQAVFPREQMPPGLSVGSSVSVIGKLDYNQKGQIEMTASEVNILGECDTTNKNYPFSCKQNHSHDYCRQYLHMRPRLKHFQSLLRIRHRATLAVHNFYDCNGFVNIHTPLLTSNDCEGAGEVFKVVPANQQLINSMKNKGNSDDEAFFGQVGFLSVSGQLHLEALTRGFCKVYSFSPTFRAENSKSRLHLSEFYMIESEEAFVDNLKAVLETIESFLKYLITDLISTCQKDIDNIVNYNPVDLNEHIKQMERIVKEKYVIMTFKEACEIIQRHKDRFKSFKCDQHGLAKEHELYLVEHVGNIPIFVIEWPKSLKPFYMKEDSSNNMVSAVDLLVPNVGELCGGSLREDSLDMLQSKLDTLNITESLQWYLDLRKFGNVPTGGFGMGFERFLQLVTSLTNIKDTIPFPRWPHSLQM